MQLAAGTLILLINLYNCFSITFLSSIFFAQFQIQFEPQVGRNKELQVLQKYINTYTPKSTIHFTSEGKGERHNNQSTLNKI